MALWLYAHLWSDLACRAVHWREYFLYERVSLVFAILLVLAVGLRNIERRLMRGLVLGIALLFAGHEVLGMGSPALFAGAVAALDPGDGSLAPVSQSTGWSCGAAATATLLRMNGVNAGEREVALLAASSPVLGTDDRGMCRAIEIIGAPEGLRSRMRMRLRADDLPQVSLPCLFGYKLYPTVWHMAVLVEIQGDKFVIEDPLLGRCVWTREEFLRKWTREVVDAVRA